MKALDFFFAARPLLHLPVWTVYLVSLHYHHRLAGGSFGLQDLLIMCGLSLLFAGAYYINQVFDSESDRINGKIGFLQNGLLTERKLMAGYLIVSLIGLGIAPFIGPTTLVLFLFIFVLGFIYSAPPLRLKDRALSGMVVNMMAYGPLISLAVMPHLTMHNSGLLGWDNPLYFALTVGATYLLTTIPDRRGDRAIGKRTMSVRFGVRTVLLLALLMLIGAAVLASKSGFPALTIVASVALMLIALALAIPGDKIILVAAKLPLLLLILASGYWYPGYLLFVVALLSGTRIYYQRRFGIAYPQLS